MIKQFTDPFPHLIIDNFLDKKQCENVINELKKKNEEINKIAVMGGRKRFHEGEFNKKSFVYKIYQTFNNIEQFNFFLNKLIPLAKDSKRKFVIKNNFKFLSKKPKNSLFLRIKKKIFPFVYSKKIFCEMDFSIGEKGYEREPHHDAPNKTVVFLLYLNDIKNNNDGGSLEIYKYKNDKQMIFKQAPDLIDVEVKKNIYPAQGKLIVFLSCPDSLHGVKKYNPENDDKRYFIYGSYGNFFNINWKNYI